MEERKDRRKEGRNGEGKEGRKMVYHRYSALRNTVNALVSLFRRGTLRQSTEKQKKKWRNLVENVFVKKAEYG